MEQYYRESCMFPMVLDFEGQSRETIGRSLRFDCPNVYEFSNKRSIYDGLSWDTDQWSFDQFYNHDKSDCTSTVNHMEKQWLNWFLLWILWKIATIIIKNRKKKKVVHSIVQHVVTRDSFINNRRLKMRCRTFFSKKSARAKMVSAGEKDRALHTIRLRSCQQVFICEKYLRSYGTMLND